LKAKVPPPTKVHPKFCPKAMSMNLIIRSATLPDAAAIASVHHTARQETYRGMIPDSHLDSVDISARETSWKSILTDHKSLVSVALLDGEICGFVSSGVTSDLVPFRTTEGKTFDGEIFAIYLLGRVQGKGIGKALVRAIAERLAKEGCESVIVWGLEGNKAARGFYERLGGKEVARKPMVIADTILEEVAYGWEDLRTLVSD
jgi:ribosomal protein S18 acetylase RimI-like enzyme